MAGQKGRDRPTAVSACWRRYDLCCSDSAYSIAKTIAIKVTAYRDEVRMATLVVRAPSWAKAAATEAAAKKGRNIGDPFGSVWGQSKAPRDCSEGAMWGDDFTYAGLASVTGVLAGGQRLKAWTPLDSG